MKTLFLHGKHFSYLLLYGFLGLAWWISSQYYGSFLSNQIDIFFRAQSFDSALITKIILNVISPIVAFVFAVLFGYRLGKAVTLDTFKKGSKSGKHLSMTIGTDNDYERKEIVKQNVVHSVYVSISNDGDVAISNCKFFLELFKKGESAGQKFIIENTFEIFPLSEPRFIRIATYTEPTEALKGPYRILINKLQMGGFFDSTTSLSVDESYVVKLSVESLEKEICKTMCKLWVEANKLKLEKL